MPQKDPSIVRKGWFRVTDHVQGFSKMASENVSITHLVASFNFSSMLIFPAILYSETGSAFTKHLLFTDMNKIIHLDK